MGGIMLPVIDVTSVHLRHSDPVLPYAGGKDRFTVIINHSGRVLQGRAIANLDLNNHTAILIGKESGLVSATLQIAAKPPVSNRWCHTLTIISPSNSSDCDSNGHDWNANTLKFHAQCKEERVLLWA